MKRGVLIVCLGIATIFLANSQVKVGATPTGKHAKVINTAKGAKNETEVRNEQARQIKDHKKATKKYESDYARLKKRKLKDFKEDSLGAPIWTEEDSIAVAEEALADLPLEYREHILNPINLDSLAVSQLETSAYNPETFAENKVKDYVPEDLVQSGDDPLASLPLDPMSSEANSTLADIQKTARDNPNLVQPEAARDLFKKIDPEQFVEAQTNVAKLKKKYSSLPDTRFPKAGRKRNSLEDLSFKKRLYFGGKINATSTDPLIMDIGLQLGYWINKKWLAGTGLIMREQFNQRDSASVTGDAHGYSFFMRYDILDEFYAWGESQHQVNRALLNNESTAPAKWEYAYLLGIGRDFAIGPVKMTTLVMYDFNYQSNNLNRRPLVFRLGVQLTKKP